MVLTDEKIDGRVLQTTRKALKLQNIGMLRRDHHFFMTVIMVLVREQGSTSKETWV